MKLIIVLGFGMLAHWLFGNPDLFQLSLTTIDGLIQPLNNLKGKKLVFVILPSARTSANANSLSSLDSICNAYSNQVTFIGIPSYEDGFIADSAATLRSWYHAAIKSPMIITNAMFTRKSSVQQDSVCAWLTNASANGHFDQDIGGVGQMYFIDESGSLYAIVSTSVQLTNKAMQRILHLNK